MPSGAKPFQYLSAGGGQVGAGVRPKHPVYAGSIGKTYLLALLPLPFLKGI